MTGELGVVDWAGVVVVEVAAVVELGGVVVEAAEGFGLKPFG